MTETSDDKEHPLVGHVLGERYRIEALLGEGGMGAVFRATHLSLDRPVAVKVLHPRLSSDEQIGKRFDREALAVSKLDHPNCVQVIDFGTTAKGMKYLVMQYLEGRELRDLTGVALPVEKVVDFGVQIFRALEHAHKRGLVHRDLKPENIFLVQDDDDRTVCKLVDFGIVKLLEGEGQEKLTRLGMAFGTPTYMSPEQAAGGKIDARTDLYAVGVLLYELLTGTPPFDADEPGILLRMHILADPPPLPDTVPKAVADVVLTLLHKEPDERYPDAREARRALAGSYRLPVRTTGRIGVVSPLPANVATDPAAVPTAAERAAQVPTAADAPSDTRADVGAAAAVAMAPGIASAFGPGIAPGVAQGLAPAPPPPAEPNAGLAPAPPPPAEPNAGLAPAPPPPAEPGSGLAPAPPPADAELFVRSGGTVLAGSSTSHGSAPVGVPPSSGVPPPSASMSHGSAPMTPMSSGMAAYDPLAVSGAHIPRLSTPPGIYGSGVHPMSGAYPVLPPSSRPGQRRSPVVAIVLVLILLTWVGLGAMWLWSRDDDRPDARPGSPPPGRAVAAPAADGLYRFTAGNGDDAAATDLAETGLAEDPPPSAEGVSPPPTLPILGNGRSDAAIGKKRREEQKREQKKRKKKDDDD